ncbi:MAG TPA: sortase [Chloroflexota bacterium]|nr:sortase [Chloroflexota bacterium]
MFAKSVSALGALLVVVGVVILGYVGFTYAQQNLITPRDSLGTSARIAELLNRRQKVALPSNLQNAHVVGHEPALRIVIPAIAVDSPVVQTPPVNGVWSVADWSVGHLSTTPNPGSAGNGAYAAHDDIKGEVFKRLGELKVGDQIRLVTQHAVYIYQVTDRQVVSPSDVAVLDPTRASAVTLISCTPYWVDTQRIAVQGVLKSVSSA